MADILAVIPARGGSKAIPGKNIVDVAGKPLIAYTIEATLASSLITDHLVSTDSEEIADIAKKFGANVPFIRPKYLGEDQSSSVDVVIHALGEMEAQYGKKYDVITLLQPTTPMRSAQTIDMAINQLLCSDAESVVSVVSVGAIHPYRMYSISQNDCLVPYLSGVEDPMMPRQNLPPVYIRSGDIYAVRRSCLLEKHSLIGDHSKALVLSPEETINIDNFDDLTVARLRLGASVNELMMQNG
jgi:CMP-N-acetylneuraminic acid synthetase